MEKTYTQQQIEYAFLKWRQNFKNAPQEFEIDSKKDKKSTAKSDAEYLIELINDVT